jgi:hypothetical protein
MFSFSGSGSNGAPGELLVSAVFGGLSMTTGSSAGVWHFESSAGNPYHTDDAFYNQTNPGPDLVGFPLGPTRGLNPIATPAFAFDGFLQIQSTTAGTSLSTPLLEADLTETPEPASVWLVAGAVALNFCSQNTLPH